MPHLSNLSWDYLDQLHSATNGTFTSYYNYDAQGNRSRKVVIKTNVREERYYIGGYEIYRKYTNDSLDYERTTSNISDDEKVFVRIETKTNESPVIRYQYDNHLGSACLELDDAGQIISYEEYHPFGTTSYRSGRGETEVSLKRYKYCEKERDEETGLYYYGMRYYAAWLCRFVSVDPLQFEYPELTPFQYASNRPITMIDLDGAEGVDPQKQKGKVINAYEVQKEVAKDNVSEIQTEIENLKTNKSKISDTEAFKVYKNSLGDLNDKLSEAKKVLRGISENYYEVENLLNEYAYYDPEGYAQLSEYVDSEGNPINIYIRIDHSLIINKEVGQLDYGNLGSIDFTAVKDNNTGKMLYVKTEDYGKNTMIINIAKGGYASTIAHEKGHFDFYFYHEDEEIEYIRTHAIEPKRHGKGDPNGIFADKATTAYKNKQKAIDATGQFFDYRRHKRKKNNL